LRAFPVAGDADVERAFADAFQLELAVERLPFRLDGRQFLLARGQEKVAHLCPTRRVADHDEIPGLHETDRRRVMGGEQKPGQHLVVDDLRCEMAAYVTPREHGAINRLARQLIKAVMHLSGHVFQHRLSPCDCSSSTLQSALCESKWTHVALMPAA